MAGLVFQRGGSEDLRGRLRRPFRRILSNPLGALPPQFERRKFTGGRASRSAVSGVIPCRDVAPDCVWKSSDNLAHSIGYERGPSGWMALEPIENYFRITPEIYSCSYVG